MNEVTLANTSDILIYNAEDGKTRIDVRLSNETVWITQNQMADLFQTTKQNISLHIKNIIAEVELEEVSVVKDFLTTASDNKRYLTKYYNLDVIIAVGYRVKSHRGTGFRKWATERLREYLVKGFTLDDERLKEGKNFGQDYFDELLERIRDIRSSEKRLYQKIRDIYALSVDYDANIEETKKFFQIVQNKLHFAISHHTAAEIIAERADANKPNMGLTTWKGNKVRQADVAIAKNYLNEAEIKQLNLIVNMYLDYAELQTTNQKPIYMQDWRNKLDSFLQFNEREILANAGKIQMEVAKKLALQEYEKFNHARIKEDDQIAEMEALEILSKKSKPKKQ